MLGGVDKQTGTQLDDLNIRYQINTFLIAGHETTSGLLSYALYALLKNPDVLAKARAEVDRVFPADSEAAPSYAQVTQLSYISQVLKESLRLWPPAPAVGLYPLKDEVIGGYRIAKGQHRQCADRPGCSAIPKYGDPARMCLTPRTSRPRRKASGPPGRSSRSATASAPASAAASPCTKRRSPWV